MSPLDSHFEKLGAHCMREQLWKKAVFLWFSACFERFDTLQTFIVHFHCPLHIFIAHFHCTMYTFIAHCKLSLHIVNFHYTLHTSIAHCTLYSVHFHCTFRIFGSHWDCGTVENDCALQWAIILHKQPIFDIFCTKFPVLCIPLNQEYRSPNNIFQE